jgi:hypothetical protein
MFRRNQKKRGNVSSAWKIFTLRVGVLKKREPTFTNIVTSQNDLFYLMGNLTRGSGGKEGDGVVRHTSSDGPISVSH